MTFTEVAKANGLDIEGYSGKWKQAMAMAFEADKGSYPESSAIELACRLFLELGGGCQRPKTVRINQFRITPHDDGQGITVGCDLIGSHIRIEPVSLTAVVVTTDDRRQEG